MTLLKFLLVLSLVFWIGGILFFAITAPNVFAVVPTRDLAGQVITRLLPILHWIGLGCGVIFLVCSIVLSRIAEGEFRPWAVRNLLVIAMLVLTCVSQFVIFARMDRLRHEMGVIDNVAWADTRRVEFNQLHVWSTRLEGLVFVLGIGAVFSVSRRLNF